MSTHGRREGPVWRPAIGRRGVAAWIVFDVGNTLFYTGIVGIFFPLWITQVRSGDDATLGYTLAAAMAVNLLVAPVVGAFSDQASRRMPYLALGAAACVVATLLLGVDGLYVSLGLFAVAIIAINCATVIYNAMLADVSTEENRGAISGLGIGIGYLGAIIAVAIGLLFVDPRGYLFSFRAVAILIFVVSIPVVLFLKESPRPRSTLTAAQRAISAWTQLRSTVGHLNRFPGMLRYLVARFWYTWSLFTGSSFAVLYATDTVGFSERQTQFVLLVGILAAIPSAPLWGILVDRVGPNRALTAILTGWVLVLLASAGIPLLELTNTLWWGVGVMSGVLIAGVWTADRPYLVSLASPAYLGEFFGLQSMTGRLAAMVGPFTWGLVSVTLGLGQPAAVLSLVGCATLALVLIRGAEDLTPDS